MQVCPPLTLKRESLIFCSTCLWTIAQMTRNLDVCNNSLPLRYGSSLSAEWLDVRAKRCATTNHELMSRKKTAIRPHNNVPQTSIIHLIPHTPPRYGAKRTDAQRQERESDNLGRQISARSPHVMQCPSRWMSPPPVARSLADACWSSVHVYTSQMHFPFSNNETPSVNALQRVETCCCCQAHEITVLVAAPPSTEDPPAGSPRLAVCHL